MSQLTKGTKVDDYVIDALVGVGGMGAVYRAVHKASGETVALKFLLRTGLDDEEQLLAARRFRDEGAAALRIKSPHLVELKATGDSAEFGPYLVLEYLSGRTLRSVLEAEGPMSPQEAYSLVAEPLLSALAHLHEAGIVHRDVKPENLFAGPDGPFKLGDLGLAAFEGREAATKTGLIVGSPGYIAPERLTSTAAATPAADCFSAAIVVCEALTGRHPQERLSAMDRVLRPITSADLRKLGLSKKLREFMALALAHSVEKRLSDARAMSLRLSELLLSGEDAVAGVGETTLVESAVHKVRTKPEGSAAGAAGSTALGKPLPAALLLIVFFLVGGLFIGHHFQGGKGAGQGGKATRKFPSLPRSLEKPVEQLKLAAERVRAKGASEPAEESLLAYMTALDGLVEAMQKRHIEAVNVVKPWEWALASLSESSPLRLVAEAASASLSGHREQRIKILDYAINKQRQAVLAAPDVGNLFLLHLLVARRLKIEDLTAQGPWVDTLFSAEQFIGQLPVALDENEGVTGSQLCLHSWRFKLLAVHGKPYMCLPLAKLCSLLLQNPQVPKSFRKEALFSLQKARKILQGKWPKRAPKMAALLNVTRNWLADGPPVLSAKGYEEAWKGHLKETEKAEGDMNGAANTLREKMRTLFENMRAYKKFKTFAELPKAFKRLVWSSHRCCWVPYVPIIPKACRNSRFLRSFSCVLYSQADLLHGSEVYKMQLSPALFAPALLAREAFERNFHGLLRLADKVRKAKGAKATHADDRVWFASEHLLLANGINWFRAAAIWYPQAQERWPTLEKRLPKVSLSRRFFSSTYAYGKGDMAKALKQSKAALAYCRSFEKRSDDTFYWFCLSHICRERWAYMRLADKSEEAALEARELQELVEPFALALDKPNENYESNVGKKRIWALSVVFQYLDALVRMDSKARLRLEPKLRLLRKHGKIFKYAAKAGFLLREEVLGPRQL